MSCPLRDSIQAPREQESLVLPTELLRPTVGDVELKEYMSVHEQQCLRHKRHSHYIIKILITNH